MIPAPMMEQLGTCPLRHRMDRLLSVAAQVNERVQVWHGRDGSHMAQITVVTDREGPVTGQGRDVCEAMQRLEQELGLETPGVCGTCREYALVVRSEQSED